MGSRPARSSSRPEWPVGSQEMRGYLAPELVRGMRGELTSGQEAGMMRSEDEVRRQTAISREQLLRDMGRMPGVPGPERYEGLRRLQDQQVKSLAGIQATTRVGAQQQAMAQALKYSMQAPGQVTTSQGPKTSTGAMIGQALGTAAMGMGGMALGGGMGAGAGMGAGMSSMPSGGAASVYPPGWGQSFSNQLVAT